MTNFHYLRRYHRLIDFYRTNIVEQAFCEKHHIVPKSMGGTNDLTNLVLLPARVHFICHYLLHRAYPENKKLAHAFAMMCVNNKFQKRNSRLYEKAKVARTFALTGVPRPQWVKDKLRKPKANKENYKTPKTEKHKQNISNSLKGKPKTQQAVLNSVVAKQKFFEKIKKETEQKQLYFRELFVKENLSRKQFAEKYNLNYNTVKRYLKGL